MMSLSENPAVLDPAGTLTQTQINALIAVSFYRNQIPSGKVVLVGKSRVSKSVINKLEQMELLRKSGRGFAPTLGGKMAIERLKGGDR